MVRLQPMIVVDDVPTSSSWFQHVVGLTSGHGGDEYEMLMDGDELVVQLHQWEVDEHPHMGDPADGSHGNGIMLWFSVDDFDAAVEHVSTSDSEVLDGPLDNPNSHLREVWVRGPDGYTVVLAGA